MLQKHMQKIDEKLIEIKEFTQREDILTDVDDPVVEENLLEHLSEIRNIIAEVAFMEGYKQGVKEITTEEVRENAVDYLDLNQFHKLLDQAGIKQK